MTDADLIAELKDDPNELGYKSDGAFRPTTEIALLLVSPSTPVKNPTPQPTIPEPLSSLAFMTLLSPASLKNLRNLPSLPRVLDDISAQDRMSVGGWIQFLATVGDITADEAKTLTGALTATILDPSWPATIPGPCRLLTLAGETFADHTQIDRVLGRPQK
jgi:hypothetical protein